jgi:hypothetical protein
VRGACTTSLDGGLATQVLAYLSEKYDGTVNPAEFLQIYTTSILTTGGDDVVMANYFPVALTGMARSWLMNLPVGTLTS